MTRSLLMIVVLAACGGSSSTPSPAPAEVAPADTPSDAAVADAAGDMTAQAAGDAAAGVSHVLPGYDGIYQDNPTLQPWQVALMADSLRAHRRNEIYARYGRPFKNDAVRSAFEKEAWYKVADDYTDDWLTEADKANAKLIRSFEGEAPERTGQVGALMFMNDSELVISDDPSMYGFVGQERRYFTAGANHVVTWTGPEDRLDRSHPEVKDIELWSWDGSEWTRTPIPRPNG